VLQQATQFRNLRRKLLDLSRQLAGFFAQPVYFAAHLLHPGWNLRFVGGRPLVGYYLEFDVAMIDKNVLPLIQIELPNRMIEVSAMYYERRYGDGHPGDQIDLSFARILHDLGIPMLDQHDALNDAIMTAEAYIALKDMKERGVRFPKKRD
jgi:DNA polymerase-3 subunit epsilon